MSAQEGKQSSHKTHPQDSRSRTADWLKQIEHRSI
jgi:hypothetical protein